ncbi:protein Wnt-8a [Nannospalax galili]|uniref:protein Wnt-8a n=1 Tax=Nannospalax galili TaxID=1026970 RepID=UPI000819F7E0|nr:protein Wnt-8a [Nannospalax galili]
MGDLFMLWVTVGMCYATFSASAWSVNNFLITGPKAYLTYATSAALGAQSGIEECKFQFVWERWNCPENALQLSTHNRLRGATRETAFIHAISSAGVMHAITKNCSMGDFENCGCDESKKGKTGGRGWIWGGCSDNVEFGERISKLFVDSLEKGKDARALMNLHNNRVGRLAARATMKRTCKCHGLSGSCSIQTCWLQLASIREIGDYLKAKYDWALKIEMDKHQLRAGNSAEGHWDPMETFFPGAEAELIFLEESPDYCTRNTSLGIYGTEGRECLQRSHNASRWEQHNCGRLCTECGLQVEERRTEATSSCNCKFQWCCTVKCDQCRHVVNKYYCRRYLGRARTRGKRGWFGVHIQRNLKSICYIKFQTLSRPAVVLRVRETRIKEFPEKAILGRMRQKPPSPIGRFLEG